MSLPLPHFGQVLPAERPDPDWLIVEPPIVPTQFPLKQKAHPQTLHLYLESLIIRLLYWRAERMRFRYFYDPSEFSHYCRSPWTPILREAPAWRSRGCAARECAFAAGWWDVMFPYHKGPDVRAFLSRKNCRIHLIQLPPYCPHLNPIEMALGRHGQSRHP